MENAGLLACGLACGTVSALVAVAPHLASAESRLNWLAIAGVLAAVAVVGLASCAVAAGKVASGALVEALREE
jgi:ABC-type antimicrobial peptide transport system permease subunit